MEKICYNNIVIQYNGKDKDLANFLADILKKKSLEIYKFFEIESLKNGLEIIIYDDINKFKQLSRFQGGWPEFTRACGCDKKLHFLNIEQCEKYTTHKQVTKEDFVQLVVHEFTHECHRQIADDFTNIWVLEGIATQIAGQTKYQLQRVECEPLEIEKNFYNNKKGYFLAYTLMGTILKVLPHSEVLKLLKSPKSVDTQYWINKTNEMANNSSHNKNN